MQRVVEPELLDELPTGHPQAIESRRDLRRLNFLMANAAHIGRALKDCPRPDRVMDLGAGDGTLSLTLARNLKWRGTEFMLVDRLAAIPERLRDEFQDLGCSLALRQCDVLAGLREGDSADVAIANLFLHHFSEDELSQLLANIADRCEIFVACEPRRSLSLFGSRCVGILGCNAVTRHDAVISVRAGFMGNELSQLWPQRTKWVLTERPVGLFRHLFTARKV